MPKENTSTGRPIQSLEDIVDINRNAIKLGLNTLGLIACWSGLSYLDPNLRPFFAGAGIACVNNMVGSLFGIVRHYRRNRIFPIIHYTSHAINVGILAKVAADAVDQNLSAYQYLQNGGLFFTSAANISFDVLGFLHRLQLPPKR